MTTGTLTIAPAGTWRLDPVHSSVGFEISYLAGTFKGQFREVEAELSVADETAKLAGTAHVGSVDVKDDNLATHLQSPDFFDLERHPELRFASEEIRLDGDSVAVHGEITIKGVTRPVELAGRVAAPITDAYGQERIGLTLSTTVDRTEFGIDWNLPLSTGQPALANEVTIVAELYFVKAA
jgi:polyisoprenoid-binding protein YceI